jgi:hypothetical protein
MLPQGPDPDEASTSEGAKSDFPEQNQPRRESSMDEYEQDEFNPYGSFGGSEVDPLRGDGGSHLPLDCINTQSDLIDL